MPHLSRLLNTVHRADAARFIARLPDESIDFVMTSPPYWGLRDYGVEGQIGLEKHPRDYIARLVAVFAELRRVLAPHGGWPQPKQLLLMPARVAGVLLSGMPCSAKDRLANKYEGRHYLGSDLNPEYVKLARQRLAATVRPASGS